MMTMLLSILCCFWLSVHSYAATVNTTFSLSTPDDSPIHGNQQEDVDVCPNVKACGQSGLRYWNILRRTLSDPNVKDRTDGAYIFQRYYATKFSEIMPSNPGLMLDLIHHGIDYRHIDKWTTWPVKPETGKMNGPFAAYENAFNTRDGAIIAAANFRVWDKNTGRASLPWSELMYYTWKAASLHADKQAGHAGGGPISNLKHVVQYIILNRQTKAVLKTIYNAKGYVIRKDNKDWKKWTEKETPYYFYALLGTDSVKSTVWLLNDHAVEIGRKIVTEIWTRWGEKGPDIWISIGAADPA